MEESAWHVRPEFNLYCKKGRGVRDLAGREREGNRVGSVSSLDRNKMKSSFPAFEIIFETGTHGIGVGCPVRLVSVLGEEFFDSFS